MFTSHESKEGHDHNMTQERIVGIDDRGVLRERCGRLIKGQACKYSSRTCRAVIGARRRPMNSKI